jgi:hypothetical protein
MRKPLSWSDRSSFMGTDQGALYAYAMRLLLGIGGYGRDELPLQVIHRSGEALENLQRYHSSLIIAHTPLHGLPLWPSGFLRYQQKSIPHWSAAHPLAGPEVCLAEDSNGACLVGINLRTRTIIFGFDVLTDTLHLLGHREELLIAARDGMDRFPSHLSPRVQIGMHRLPVINYYARLLAQALKILGFMPEREQRPFVVFLSHDVDNITDRNFYVMGKKAWELGRNLAHGSWSQAANRARSLRRTCFRQTDPYWHFETYMDLENAFGARSSFYFMNGAGGRYGSRYRLSRVAGIMRKLQEHGWEVGLHTHPDDYRLPHRIRSSKTGLEKVIHMAVQGARSHYLVFQVPATWRNLQDAGLSYDATIGYEADFGFRSGLAFPYHPVDLNTGEVLDILELPLAVMDGGVFARFGDPQEILEHLESLINEVADLKGMLSLLWHQRVLDNLDYPGWGWVYRELLRLCARRGAVFMTGNDINRQFRRSFSHLGRQ